MKKEPRTIQVDSVIVPESRRPIDDAHVVVLAESMRERGLIQRIAVAHNRSLLDGAHRLAAAKSLGWTTIDAEVWDGEAIDLAMLEIDANISKPITVRERARLLARAKALHLAKHPETANPNVRGGPGRGRKTSARSAPVSAPTFVASTAAKTGKSERTIENEVAIGERLTTEAESVITGTPVEDNAAALARISKKDREDQVEQAKAEVEKSAEPRKPKLRLVSEGGRTIRRHEREAAEFSERVRPLLLSGLTVGEIAKKLGCDRQKVQYAKGRLGLSKKMNRDPFTRIAETAAEFGHSLRDLMACAEEALDSITAQQARTAVSALDELVSVVRGIQKRLNKEAAKEHRA